MDKQALKRNEIIPPQISEETMRGMSEFFRTTSVPRILAAKQAEQQKEVKSK